MNNFWLLCRKEANLSLRQMSKLLNVSAHTYNAMEQGKIHIPPEIIEMLYLIYNISHSTLIDEKESLLKIQNEFSSLDEGERFYNAMRNLTGEGSYNSNYRKIKEIKDRILK